MTTNSPAGEPTHLVIDGSQDLITRRRLADLLVEMATEPAGVAETEVTVAHVPVSVYEPGADVRATIVHCHGGHSMCSRASHRRFAMHLALATQCRVALVGYRRTPEHRYTAAIDDTDLVVRHAWGGPVVLSGESAGGGIVLSAFVDRNLGRQLAGLVMLSPWLDRGLSGASIDTNASRDWFVTRRGLEVLAEEIFGSVDLSDATVSPLFADLQGLPPTLVQVAEEEILRDDSRRFAQMASEAGSAVELQEYNETQHAWHLAAGNLAVADQALAAIAMFLNPVLTGEPSVAP